MKAITTKYVGPTTFKGPRLIAPEPDGKRCIISYPHEYDTEAAHRIAAETLRDKLGWKGALAGGYLGKSAWAWVFVGAIVERR